MSKHRVLGIDPGSRMAGYGVIDVDETGQKFTHVTHGTLKLQRPKEDLPMHIRLGRLHDGLRAVIEGYQPTVVAVEKAFFAKNAVSALKLGQARGVALLSAAQHDLELFEYSPTEIKRAIVGHGRADKEQVAKLVRLLLGGIRGPFETTDASDALAIAVCHAQLSRVLDPSLDPLRRTVLERAPRKKRTLSEALAHRIKRPPLS